MEVGQTVIKGIKVGTLLRTIAQIFTWVNTLFLVRILTPEDYSLMAMTMVFISILALMGDFGISKAIIQAKECTPLFLRQAFSFNILVSLCIFLGLWFLAPVAANFFNEERVKDFIRVVSIQHLIMMLHTVPYALASRNMLFKQRETVHFFSILITSILTLTMALTGFGVWSLLIGHVASRLFLTIGFFLLQPYMALPTLNFQNFKGAALFSTVASINDALRLLMHTLTTISVAKFLSKVDLGHFSVVKNLSNLPSDKIGEMINHIGLASFAKMQHDPKAVGDYLLKSVQLAAFILFPVYFGMVLVADEFFFVVLSDKWTMAVIPFQIMCLASPFTMIAQIIAIATTAIGYPKKYTSVLLLTLFLLPMLFIGKQYGLVGVCIVWLFMTMISFLLHMQGMLSLFSVTYNQFFVAMLPSFFGALVMLIVSFFLKYYYIEYLESWITLIVTIIIGATLFFVFMYLFYKKKIIIVLKYLRH